MPNELPPPVTVRTLVTFVATGNVAATNVVELAP
jgi:hypothetical protein